MVDRRVVADNRVVVVTLEDSRVEGIAADNRVAVDTAAVAVSTVVLAAIAAVVDTATKTDPVVAA